MVMVDDDTKFLGSVPENYDRFLGPVLFEPYPIDLASRIPQQSRLRILELACGTGILTTALKQRLSSDSTIVATDLNEPMLSYARSKFTGVENIGWLVADATVSPFVEKSFDAIICQFGLMFVPDKIAALSGARELIRPDGRLLMSVWDRLSLNSFQRIAHETLLRLFPVNPPLFYQVPFTMWNREDLCELLTAAGFISIEIEAIEKPAVAESARSLATGLVFGNPLISAIEERGTLTADFVVDEISNSIEHQSGVSPRGLMRAIVVTARTEH